MTTAADAYEKLVQKYEGDAEVSAGQMFGKPCLKAGGKAFVAQQKDWVVFKLGAPEHAQAMAMEGAVLWDPSGKGRPMKEWVALPVTATATKSFAALAKAAKAYVGGGA